MTTFTPAISDRLRAAGWMFHRQGKGDHEIWTDPSTGKRITVDGKVRSRALANKILKDAGLGKQF